MQIFDSILRKARAHRQSIVLAEGEDPRIIEAARRASDEGIAKCILVGNEAAIRNQAKASGIELTDISIEDPKTSQYYPKYSKDLWKLRKHKGMSLEQAEQQALDPLCFADLMLRANNADGAIAGAVYTTGDRVRSALQIIGDRYDFARKIGNRVFGGVLAFALGAAAQVFALRKGAQ